jgi:hypothetical protein
LQDMHGLLLLHDDLGNARKSNWIMGARRLLLHSGGFLNAEGNMCHERCELSGPVQPDKVEGVADYDTGLQVFRPF